MEENKEELKELLEILRHENNAGPCNPDCEAHVKKPDSESSQESETVSKPYMRKIW